MMKEDPDKCEMRFDAVFTQAPLGIALIDSLTGHIHEVNPMFAKIAGRTMEEMARIDWMSITHPDDVQMDLDQMARLNAGEIPGFQMEKRYIHRDGTVVWISMTIAPVKTADKTRPRHLCMIQDITARKRSQTYADMGRDILKILAEPGELKASMRRIVETLKAGTGFEAVGIRLQDGEDFPYAVQDGFSEDFVRTENTLIARGPDGKACRDASGCAKLECTCGLVISGKGDTTSPLFTPAGSFWTNDSPELLGIPAAEDPRFHPRNKCIKLGYASVALVPIRDGERNIGLIQFNDSRKDCFTLETLKLLEDISMNIGAALMRKKAEDALKESERSFMDVLYSSPSAMLLIDGNKFVDCNEAAARMLRYPDRKDFLMTHPSALSPAVQPDGMSSRDKADEMIRTALAQGFHQFEWTHRKADGEPFPVKVSLTPVTLRGRTLLHCVWHDLTALKENEAALAQAQGLSATVLDSIDDHILILDSRTFQIQGANKAFLDDYGLTREQIMGRTCHEVTHGSGTPCSGTGNSCPIQAMMATGTWAKAEHVHPGANGEASLVEIAIHPIKNPGGEIEQVVHISRDITESRRKDQKALELEKLESLGTLAGGIAHDFNNILTAILGNISLLKPRMAGDGEASEILAEAQNACATAKGLSNQLLTFAKGGNPITSAQDLRPVLTQAATFAARGSSARCVFDLGDSPLIVNIDKDQISRVIQNLVINAAQAMPQGGDITMRTEVVALEMSVTPHRAAGRYVRLTVTDQGAGIKPEHLSRIFEPYFSTKGVGRGLGLAMAYSIMAKHGGNISAELKPGAGAVFILHLPVDDAADVPAVKDRPALTAGSGKVLIMDDEAALAKVLKRIVEHLGYRTEVVKDGQAALDAYARAMKEGKPYDAVILDLTIAGGMGGKEAISKLKALDPRAKAIVSSGYANDPVMAGYAAHGFSGMLGKPYTIEQVSEALRLVLGRS